MCREGSFDRAQRHAVHVADGVKIEPDANGQTVAEKWRVGEENEDTADAINADVSPL
jgi:hypothetical protein